MKGCWVAGHTRPIVKTRMSDKNSPDRSQGPSPASLEEAALKTPGERETAVTARESAVLGREESTAIREEAARLREEVTRVHENLASIQEEAARLTLSTTKEEATKVELLLSRLREANEHLVVATVRAQTLTEAAEQTNRRQEEFLATLAHELRNPLAPIRNAAAILSLVGPAEPRVQYVRDVITRQVEHMARLLDDLLDVARLSTGKIELQRRPVAVSEFAALAVEACRPLLDARAQHLTLDIPAQPLYVDGDPMRLAQVFSNLLNNAAKYTQEGGAISLSAQRRDGAVVLCVKDNGGGISAEVLPRIFDLFAQEGRPGGSRGGLGIGLTVVRHMLEMHGGTVDVRSAGVNQGSEFFVTLPLLQTPTPEAVVSGEGKASSPLPRYRIVLVDDHVDANASLQELLQMMGHDVSTAFDGATALELVQETRPQIVICDIGLPDLDGYAVIMRLREQMKGAMPVMIALTGYGQEKDRSLALAAGFDEHMVKPVDATALLRFIATQSERIA